MLISFTLCDRSSVSCNISDALFKEAKILREQAEELVPTKKKPTVKKTVESA